MTITRPIDPPRNLLLTAEITLVLPFVAVPNRQITANFNEWTAVLPDDFAKFFMYTPYHDHGILPSKIVTGTLLYEPSITTQENGWSVEVFGDSKAVLTLYTITPEVSFPLGYAVFNGRFPAGIWRGSLQWKKPAILHDQSEGGEPTKSDDAVRSKA